MVEIECVDCGRLGRFKQRPSRREVRCPVCRTLSQSESGEQVRGFRHHLLGYPVPLSQVKRFYRVLVGIDSFAKFHAAVLDERCIRLLSTLSEKILATNHKPERIERRVRESLELGSIASATQHRLLSDLADEQGLSQRALTEWEISNTLVQRIRESGDGTEDSPYLLVDVADQYLVLKQEGRDSVARYTVETEDGYCDVHECDDGSEAWFEVTAQVEANARSHRSRAG